MRRTTSSFPGSTTMTSTARCRVPPGTGLRSLRMGPRSPSATDVRVRAHRHRDRGDARRPCRGAYALMTPRPEPSSGTSSSVRVLLAVDRRAPATPAGWSWQSPPTPGPDDAQATGIPVMSCARSSSETAIKILPMKPEKVGPRCLPEVNPPFFPLRPQRTLPLCVYSGRSQQTALSG